MGGRTVVDGVSIMAFVGLGHLRDSPSPPFTRMITGFFLQIGYTIVAFFVGILPIVSIPSGWTTALTLIWSYLNSFAFFFPVSTLTQVLTFAVVFHLALLGYDLSLKIYHMIRG